MVLCCFQAWRNYNEQRARAANLFKANIPRPEEIPEISNDQEARKFAEFVRQMFLKLEGFRKGLKSNHDSVGHKFTNETNSDQTLDLIGLPSKF